MQEAKKLNKEELTSSQDPVFYCSSCFSLKIIAIKNSKEESYCGCCGETEIKEESFEDWEKKYIKAYQRAFFSHIKTSENEQE